MSLEPAIGAALGFALLGQHLPPTAVVAIALIVVASVGAMVGVRRT